MQIEFFCLEQLIGADNPVRVIEAFVEGLDMEQMGFQSAGKSHEGRPAFSSKTLLKLYLYGYQHGIRSSRKLEAECARNVEVWWLLGRQAPGYKTIADFRKETPGAFKAVFRKLVGILKEWKLIGGHTLAVDSAKIRAQNSKKNNFTAEKIGRMIERSEFQDATDLIFTGYNLTRCLNILVVKALLERIQAFWGLVLGLLRRFPGLQSHIFRIRATKAQFALGF